MAIGRNFTEALNKALRSLEHSAAPFSCADAPCDVADLRERVRMPHDGRLRLVMDAIRAGATIEQLHDATGIDPWFLDQLVLIDEIAGAIATPPELTPERLRLAKRHGLSDAQIGAL